VHLSGIDVAADGGEAAELVCEELGTVTKLRTCLHGDGQLAIATLLVNRDATERARGNAHDRDHHEQLSERYSMASSTSTRRARDRRQ
jgi:hypothetical protein